MHKSVLINQLSSAEGSITKYTTSNNLPGYLPSFAECRGSVTAVQCIGVPIMLLLSLIPLVQLILVIVKILGTGHTTKKHKYRKFK